LLTPPAGFHMFRPTWFPHTTINFQYTRFQTASSYQLRNEQKGVIMLKKQLQKYFGFNSFLKGQEEVIHKVLELQSATAIFPTGAGKSLCYQLPAMLLPGVTLVVSPLLSLMKDQLDFLLENNIPAARLDSTLEKS